MYDQGIYVLNDGLGDVFVGIEVLKMDQFCFLE